jgi:hypothetical protein
LGFPSFWSPKLIFIRGSPFFFIAFIAFVAFVAGATLGGILGSTFIGFRGAEFTLAQGTVFGAVKLLLVVVLATMFNVFGIFASRGLGLTYTLVSLGQGLGGWQATQQ